MHCKTLITERLELLIQSSRIALVIFYPRLKDNRSDACNPAFVELTRSDEASIAAWNFRLLARSATEPWLTATICGNVRKHSRTADAVRNAVSAGLS
jgi:hypothetical protein